MTNLKKEIQKFRVLEFQRCFIGTESLLKKQIQYDTFQQNGNTQKCREYENEFLEINLEFYLEIKVKELIIDSSIILDSQMFQELTSIEKLSIIDSFFNSFTLRVIRKFHKISELKVINYYYPKLSQIDDQQIQDYLDNFSIQNLKSFKNLKKLTFLLQNANQKDDIKQILEENFSENFDLTLYSLEKIILIDICNYAFYKQNFKVKFITKQLTLIDMNRLPQIQISQLSHLFNEKNNLQITQELFSHIGIFIQLIPNEDAKYRSKSLFSVRVEKNDYICNSGKLDQIKLCFDLFLFDYYEKEAKLSLFKRININLQK